MTKILLLEDDHSLSLGLVYAYNKAGYRVIHAKNLSEAREAVQKEAFDLYILDIGLPDGTGFEFAEELRRENPQTPIIFLTARDEEEDIVKGFEIGAQDYVKKPFYVKELLLRTERVLEHTQRTSDYYESDGVRLDRNEMRVTVDGKTVELTSSEFRILLFFLQNPKRVLTRGQILDQLWENGAEYVEDNTLSVYISRLREKLDSKDTMRYIKTVRGVGYVWDKEVHQK